MRGSRRSNWICWETMKWSISIGIVWGGIGCRLYWCSSRRKRIVSIWWCIIANLQHYVVSCLLNIDKPFPVTQEPKHSQPWMGIKPGTFWTLQLLQRCWLNNGWYNMVIMADQCCWTNNVVEQTMLLNKQCCWTNNVLLLNKQCCWMNNVLLLNEQCIVVEQTMLLNEQCCSLLFQQCCSACSQLLEQETTVLIEQACLLGVNLEVK